LLRMSGPLWTAEPTEEESITRARLCQGQFGDVPGQSHLNALGALFFACLGFVGLRLTLRGVTVWTDRDGEASSAPQNRW